MIRNKLVEFLDKPAVDFNKSDIIRFIEKKNIQMVNFRYIAGDGRLKTLNFVINSKKQLDSILTIGERVDGSSLFKYIEAGSSDLYVVPRYRSAFVNPFSEVPTLDILCYYYTNEGEPLPSSSENILRKAKKVLEDRTALNFKVMGELEYYINSVNDSYYKAGDQKGYHESEPYSKWGFLRTEAMRLISECGGNIKYGHTEVGNFKLDNIDYEQNEIEFFPTDMEDAADQLVIAKWILRMLGEQYGVEISFAPKIVVGKAGSGLHIHTKLDKDGKNMMIENNKLSTIAKKAIAGYLDLAPSLTAFGNTVPTSYLRLVPHQEAPTKICWGDRNRSVLVRVPLGWLNNAKKMIIDANPKAKTEIDDSIFARQTVEFRCPDGSANIHLLIAGLAVAARHGLEMKDALKKTKEKYVNVNIFKDEHKEKYEQLDQLPLSCWESADCLLKQSNIYKKYDVFPQSVIDGVAQQLKSYNDKGLSEKLYGKDDEIKKLVEQYMHCG